MATLLLLVIYVSFIGLGIPDSLFGAAWPAIYQELQLPVSMASCVTLLISGCTVIASLLSAKIINRFGTAGVTAASTALTAAALLGFSLSANLAWLCLFAVPLGLGAGAIDSALNNYVALHYKAAHMSFLHCFYGIGVSISPYFMSLALSNGNWRSGYRTAFLIQLVIAVITVLSLPLWKRVSAGKAAAEDMVPSKSLRISEMMRMPSVRTVWFIFICSCGIEYTCGIWGSTYLVQSRGLPMDAAAGIITFYYIGMALGRFLSGLLASKLSSWKLIFMGQGILIAALLLLILPLPPAAAGIGLFIIGLGNGPIFPNLIHLTPSNFGKDISQSVMGTQMAASYIGIMLIPPVFGLIAQPFGTGLLPCFLLVLFAIMLTATAVLLRKLKRKQGMG